MPEVCGNIKALLADLQGRDLSSTAKLVAILESCGISDREEIENLLECKSSTLREARRALKIQRQNSITARNPAPEIQRNAGNPAQTPEIQRQNSSVHSCAGATNELPTEVSSSKVITLPLPPKPSQTVASVCEIAHGVSLVDKTITHKDFSISLAAMEMGTLASGMSRERIQEICLQHALQWAVEIEGGKEPRNVLPGKIANFLSASIMGVKNRDASQKSKFHPPSTPMSYDAVFAQIRAGG